MNKHNFVTPDQGNQGTYQLAVPEVMPVNPAAAFDGREPRQPNVDPLRRDLGFNVKYAPLAVVIVILAIGLGLQNNWSVGTSLIVFGVIAIMGYWLLGFTENVFDPYSGHVVKAFFGWLVLRRQIQANETIAVAYYTTEQKRLELQVTEKASQQEQRVAVERRLVAPQAEMNQLATYAPVHPPVHPPVSREALASVVQIDLEELPPPAWAKVPVQRNDGSAAVQALLDFVEDVYGQELYGDDGTLKKGVRAPWAQRGTGRNEAFLSGNVKRQAVDMLGQITPPLFVFVEETKLWRLNIDDYPEVEDAYSALDDVRVRAM